MSGFPWLEHELSVGERVAVSGLPGGGRPLGRVAGIGPKNVKVAMCNKDYGVVYVKREQIDPIDWRCGGGLDTGKLVVVPCSGAKLTVPAMAGVMYTGSLHRLAMRAAHATTEKRMIRILSGRYGLLGLEDEIEPYEQRIDEPGAVGNETLAGQLAELGWPDLVALTPKTYTERLLEVTAEADCTVTTPLEGCRGIGDMRSRLSQLATRSTR